MALSNEYDAVVLDLGLPVRPGIDVLKLWRRRGSDVPVLILTAHGSWREKVDGLNAGADDYITKPFHVAEVAARLRALIRRKSGIVSSVIERHGIRLDTGSGIVMRADTKIDLTAQEMRMLTYFMHRIGRIVSQSELATHLYALHDERDSNTIEVFVSRLRRKLGHDIIKTVRGLGYRMD
jgi:DNA-binding response OmpR family regulator